MAASTAISDDEDQMSKDWSLAVPPEEAGEGVEEDEEWEDRRFASYLAAFAMFQKVLKNMDYKRAGEPVERHDELVLFELEFPVGDLSWIVCSIAAGEDAPTGGAENNLPDWAPFPHRVYETPSHHNEAVFFLNEIVFDAEVRDRGHGRRFINIVQQTLTRDTKQVQYIEINVCHFPIFYMIDSHYGWARSANGMRVPIPADTPAGLIYPRFYPVSEIYKKRMPQLMKNEEAIYKYVSLEWATPLKWALARTMELNARPPVDDLLAQNTPAFFKELNALLGGAAIVIRLPVITEKEGGMPKVMITKKNLHGYVPMRLVESVEQHCRDLGNSDPSVYALYLGRDSLVVGPTEKRFILLLLAYLVDHCRVLYRPIVISEELRKRLCDLYEVATLQDLFTDTKLMPQPAPYFSFAKAIHEEDEECWIWVPVKKPHSSTYDGETFLPLPARELAPPWFAAAAGHPSRSTTQACQVCDARTPVAHSRTPMVMTCSTACRAAYYRT
jgi:hypothetical protein